jgi:hypothetical protein
MSRIEIVTDKMRVIEVKAVDYPAKVFDSPAKCAHYNGLLGQVGLSGPLPEECLVCPKILQCEARKR